MTNPLYFYGIFPQPRPPQIDLAGLDDQPVQELQQLMQENADLRAERDRLEGKTLSMAEIVKIGQAVE